MKLTYRLATEADLSEIVRMLADDELGTSREMVQEPLLAAYLEAFRVIAHDKQQELTVVEADGAVVATFQLTFIQYLTYRGGVRAQIEAVRVKSTHRGQGIGTEIFNYASQRAKQKGAHMLQLTTDKRRPDAKRFYTSLGFIDSHEGMKLPIV
ncbi:GNAT family N-acetyltransferase [Spirosoma horti]